MNRRRRLKEIRLKLFKILLKRNKHIFNSFFINYKIERRISNNKKDDFKIRNSVKERSSKRNRAESIKNKDNLNKPI